MGDLIPEGFYRKTRGIIRRGLRADQPSATEVLEGTIYYVTDESKLERSTGSAWEAYSTSASGDVTGPSSSVDSEITLFSGTTGKIIKRATGTGVVHSTSGVYSTSSVALTEIATIATNTILGNASGISASPSAQTSLPSGVQDNITRTGTVGSGTWSASFGAVSGAALTNLTAANISAGTAGINISGNSATTTKLQTARNINGVAFDGTAAITVAAAAGTLTGATLASGVTVSSLTSLGTLVGLNCSGQVNIPNITSITNTGSFSLSNSNYFILEWNGGGSNGTFTGISSGSTGQIIIIYNVSTSDTLTITNSTSADNFRTSTGANINLTTGQGLIFYKRSGSYWAMIGKAQ